ncbi:hypothetical protein FVEG_16159 [Fusarium verticillioides 7600]|uniref:Uncharacterized protein n=1 Tax=Gibberella moniliformis (strain M3125 / FGSC 7600) TaxID=334819 RepID=W7MIW1_GIBM7|nr:hypothetical protein FVEG_16159 [Fusarium verticillioides 7600]EWG47594.1 hypothetical protein FVEG_16159 [Fusarium verticillioides 7600]
MEFIAKTSHEAEIRDRLHALDYEVHALKLGSRSLARKFGLNEYLENDAGSFLAPAARKQGEIQRRTKVLENGIRTLKWSLGLPDMMSSPAPSGLVDTARPVPPAETYCLAPQFEALLDDLQNSGMIEKNKRLYYTSTAADPKQQRENETMMAFHFRRHENPDIAGPIPDLNPKLRVGRRKVNPHSSLSIKHSILREFIHDANRNIRNVACSLYLRRECKAMYTYNFNELDADIFYDWQWLRSLQSGDVLAGDIEVLGIRNQMICDMIDNREDPIFEDRAALWPSIVFGRLKPDF